MLSLLAAWDEDMVNVTPTLLRFIGKFFAVFAIVAVVGILTPFLAKKIDALRAKHGKAETPEDLRVKAVKGIYDAQEETEPEETDKEQPAEKQQDDPDDTKP